MSGVEVPEQRRAATSRVVEALRSADAVVLTTHVNADGDGAGSEAAVAAWLAGLGRHVRIVNPTPFPESFCFLVPDAELIADAGSVAADRALAQADLLIVLDTAEASRIGRVAKGAAQRELVIIDHHVATDSALQGLTLQDPTACATGELVFDMLVTAGLERPWAPAILQGLYTAIVTDTGSFRYANTTPRTHRLAAELIAQGVDPEAMYRHIHGNVPLHRLKLLRHALENLAVEPDVPITSITIRRGVMEELGASSDDLDGIVEHARSIEGTEVAILFRETSDGATKVSLRSAGEVDVNAVAREFGGGGHIKASGALIGEPIEVARPRVIAATRAAVERALPGFRTAAGPA